MQDNVQIIQYKHEERWFVLKNPFKYATKMFMKKLKG